MLKQKIQPHLPTLSLAIICVILQIIWHNSVSTEPNSLIFYNFIPLEQQPLALITATLLHTNINHLLMNFAAYFLIYHYSFTALKSWKMPLVTMICGVGAILGFAATSTENTSLVGLSGALHGCLVYMAICEIKDSPKLMAITLVCVIAKITYEQIFGASSLTVELIAAKVATECHLYGAITGGLLAGIVKIRAATSASHS